MQTKLRKYDKAYRMLYAENAELEKKLDKSTESVLRKLEINHQLGELEELCRTIAELLPKVLQCARRIAVHNAQEKWK